MYRKIENVSLLEVSALIHYRPNVKTSTLLKKGCITNHIFNKIMKYFEVCDTLVHALKFVLWWVSKQVVFFTEFL